MKNFILSALIFLSFTFSTQSQSVLLMTELYEVSTLPFIGITLGLSYSIGNAIENRNPTSFLMTVYLAAIVLDKKNLPTHFRQLDDQTSQNANLSEKEKDAFQKEFETINLSAEEANFKVINAPKEERQDVALKALEDFKKNISPDAFSAVMKISHYTINQIQGK